MKFKKLGFGLSALTALSAIPISIITMPLVLNQPVQAVCTTDGCSDVRLCPADRPCIEASQSGDRMIFQFTNSGGWDFYNVRYPVRGGEKQVENRSGSFTFKNIQPNSVYTIKVQGCNSHTFRRSTCSPWNEESVTTR
ncbi:hypothetical protein H1Q63_01580 [Desmonostoc muscorum CCALA 125]|nr:hypothetical protein [Desmonostoc muscorum CCALA 125]